MSWRALLFYFTAILITFTGVSCNSWKDVTVDEFEGFQMKKFSKDGIEGSINLKIGNPNKIGFSIYSSVTEVSVNGNKVGEADLTNSVHIDANCSKTYAINFICKFDKNNGKDGLGLNNLLAIALSRQAEIKMKGELLAGKFIWRKRIPFEFSKKIPLSLN